MFYEAFKYFYYLEIILWQNIYMFIFPLQFAGFRTLRITAVDFFII